MNGLMSHPQSKHIVLYGNLTRNIYLTFPILTKILSKEQCILNLILVFQNSQFKVLALINLSFA